MVTLGTLVEVGGGGGEGEDGLLKRPRSDFMFVLVLVGGSLFGCSCFFSWTLIKFVPVGPPSAFLCIICFFQGGILAVRSSDGTPREF